jgi:CspA family cold shock protein
VGKQLNTRPSARKQPVFIRQMPWCGADARDIAQPRLPWLSKGPQAVQILQNSVTCFASLIALLALSARVRKANVEHQQWESSMARGTVKWFNSQKGYGFIQPQGGGGKDVFVHISAVERAGLSGLNEGQIVEYEEVADKGKTSAQNLKVQR